MLFIIDVIIVRTVFVVRAIAVKYSAECLKFPLRKVDNGDGVAYSFGGVLYYQLQYGECQG
jgi:hypothetical protein